MGPYVCAFISLPGGSEWLWIFLIFLILFGATALPKLFRSLGRSVREFKKAQDGLYDEMDKAAGDQDDDEKKKHGPATGSKPADKGDD